MASAGRRSARLLVTGHRGYIGAVLVPMLEGLGHEVVGVDSDLYRGCDFGPVAADRVPMLAADVRDLRATDLRGVEAVQDSIDAPRLSLHGGIITLCSGGGGPERRPLVCRAGGASDGSRCCRWPSAP